MRRVVLTTVFFFLGLPSAGYALSYEAQLVREAPASGQISFLGFDQFNFPVIRFYSKGKPALAVRIKGKYARENWTLVHTKEQNVQVEEGEGLKEFGFLVPLTGSSVYFALVAVGPRGEVEQEVFRLVFPQWEQFLKGPKRVWSYRVLLGSVVYDYEEAGQSDLAWRGLAMRGGVERFFSRDFSIGLNTTLAAFPLSSSRDEMARWITGDLDMGYLLRLLPESWQLRVHMGLSYSTMQVANDAFGYKNLLYVQYYPTLRYSLPSGDGISAYLKYVPLTRMVSFSWRERKIGAGLSWEHILRNGHSLLLDLDVSGFRKHSSNDASVEPAISYSSWSVSLGYQL